MATLKQLRQRIRTAKNIQQITRAMKLVAAARLKRATDRVVEARPYADKMKEFMQGLASAGELPEHPLMKKRDVTKVGLLVVTADRGLAGSYNTNLIRKAGDFVAASPDPVRLITIGRKGTTFFTKRDYDVARSFSVSSAGATLENVQEVSKYLRELFESGEVDAIYVCYSKFYSAIRQSPQVVQVLPISAPAVTTGESQGQTSDFLFEPDAASLLDTLLPRYFLTLIQQAMFEGTASEFGARMTAMTSATDAAGKMITELTLKANRQRQAGITTEILEVVGGAEALKS